MAKAIELRNVSYSYPDGTKALQDVNLELEEGECLGLVGASGSGKSTLCLCLVGLLTPQTGEIKIFGEELNKKNLDRIRKKTGLIFQNPDDQLFMHTLYDDVAFGLVQEGLQGEELEKKVKKALAEQRLEKMATKFPGHLSLGQKRLATLAGVMVMEPEILILDEPSANLDPLSRRNLINQLDRVKTTKLLVGHDLEMVLELCQRVVVLKDGRVFARGIPSEVLGDSSLMQACDLEVPHSLLPHSERHHRHKT